MELVRRSSLIAVSSIRGASVLRCGVRDQSFGPISIAGAVAGPCRRRVQLKTAEGLKPLTVR
jgi:hypothetical protein